jgi:hypothetical protein
MAKIFEVLSSDITEAGFSEFVVDSSVAQVAVQGPPAGNLDFFNAGGNAYFSAGDNIIISEIICSIPYGFGPGTGQVQAGILWSTSGGDAQIINELGGNSSVTFPNLCSLNVADPGIFITAPRNSENKLVLSSIQLNVSQLNVPALIDGQTLKVQFHIKLFHTLPMFTPS